MTRIEIATKQQPVINHLNDLFDDALATANAILDNSTDDKTPIPVELVISFHKASNQIIETLWRASMKP
jgi:hypothetical protein